MGPVPMPIPYVPRELITKLDEAEGEIANLRKTVSELTHRVGRQTVLLQALFALMRERQGLTEADLLDRFRQVEVERASAKKCLKCGRAINPRNNRCMYCDEPSPVEQSVFDLL